MLSLYMYLECYMNHILIVFILVYDNFFVAYTGYMGALSRRMLKIPLVFFVYEQDQKQLDPIFQNVLSPDDDALVLTTCKESSAAYLNMCVVLNIRKKYSASHIIHGISLKAVNLPFQCLSLLTDMNYNELALIKLLF